MPLRCEAIWARNATRCASEVPRMKVAMRCEFRFRQIWRRSPLFLAQVPTLVGAGEVFPCAPAPPYRVRAPFAAQVPPRKSHLRQKHPTPAPGTTNRGPQTGAHKHKKPGMTSRHPRFSVTVLYNAFQVTSSVVPSGETTLKVVSPGPMVTSANFQMTPVGSPVVVREATSSPSR